MAELSVELRFRGVVGRLLENEMSYVTEDMVAVLLQRLVGQRDDPVRDGWQGEL